MAASRSPRACRFPITGRSKASPNPLPRKKQSAPRSIPSPPPCRRFWNSAAKGARRLEAVFFRADGAVRRIAIEMGMPTREPAVIDRLFREKLDALADPLDPGFGFDLIRLSASRVERADWKLPISMPVSTRKRKSAFWLIVWPRASAANAFSPSSPTTRISPKRRGRLCRRNMCKPQNCRGKKSAAPGMRRAVRCACLPGPNL